jgi:Ca-activated chloride channel family protein
MHIQPDRALIPAGAPAVRYLQIVITAPATRATVAATRPAVAVALVLDRSGSMDGTKIAMARTAVDHAVRLLKPHDHLAVVCYDDRVDTVLSCTPASKEAKDMALGRLAEIDARGSTDLEGGWMRGADELRGEAGAKGGESHDQKNVRRVLLLTDGLANRGVTDHQELASTAVRLRTEGVTTSTFGVGVDFDEQLLARLATEGGGHFYFIERPQQIPDFFASELGETLDIVARDAIFEISCAPAMRPTLVNELPAEQAEGRLRVRLGDLVADQEISLIVAVSFAGPLAAGLHCPAQCRVFDRDQVLFPEPMTVDWQVAEASEHDAQPVNLAVLRAAAMLLAARARATALAANRRGAFDEARGIVREMIDTLRGLAPGDAAVGAVIAQLQQDEVDFAAMLSPIDSKRRHYASHSASRSRAPDGTARRRTES